MANNDTVEILTEDEKEDEGNDRGKRRHAPNTTSLVKTGPPKSGGGRVKDGPSDTMEKDVVAEVVILDDDKYVSSTDRRDLPPTLTRTLLHQQPRLHPAEAGRDERGAKRVAAEDRKLDIAVAAAKRSGERRPVLANPYVKRKAENPPTLSTTGHSCLPMTAMAIGAAKKRPPLPSRTSDLFPSLASASALSFSGGGGGEKSSSSRRASLLASTGVVLRKEEISDEEEDSDDGAVPSEEGAQPKGGSRRRRPLLYHDPRFLPHPSSVDGEHRSGINLAVKCRCAGGVLAELAYSTKEGPNLGEPFYRCGNGRGGGGRNTGRGGPKKKCSFFRWAYRAERMQWRRFGLHTGHIMVGDGGFSAEDLVQGKVGDCWFLSALAVVAERPDLIMRLFRDGRSVTLDGRGKVEVRLFVDGFWKRVVMDDFLPCIIGKDEKEEVERAIRASLSEGIIFSLSEGTEDVRFVCGAGGGGGEWKPGSSEYDPAALSDVNARVLRETVDFLAQDRAQRDPTFLSSFSSRRGDPARNLSRPVSSSDLAYSVARGNQLWVPFLEKAYAKMHGSYRSISGGHIAEAFLDLTGCPALSYVFDSPDFRPRQFWAELMEFRRRRLPMGCATDKSQAGIVGMHAYSILDVREVKGVGLDFFREKMLEGTLGGVSGFTEFDGTVRLLRVRNPHGRGEWKGEFSDRSVVWERLFQSRRGDDYGAAGTSDTSSPVLRRTMKDDGTFWIDYDSFLVGFSNVDVVLAYEDICAKSFGTNFPFKKDNHRCTRAFEVSLVEEACGGPGSLPCSDEVEVYIMAIQKTRRGASHGRADRKKSYKICDTGILVGEVTTKRRGGQGTLHNRGGHVAGSTIEFDRVEGKMFGLRRIGYCRAVLRRRRDGDGQKNRSLVVMPVSFGHPAATDADRSFVLRFVSDAPVRVCELPEAPRMDEVFRAYCLEAIGPCQLDAGATRHGPKQRTRRVLLEDEAGQGIYGEPVFQVIMVDCLGEGGGTAFVYLCVNDKLLKKVSMADFFLSLHIMVNCRGMVCRTENGLLQHETVARGKKFEAAWRRYSADFFGEERSRLLMVLVQSGQDSELGAIDCKEKTAPYNRRENAKSLTAYFEPRHSPGAPPTKRVPKSTEYEERGIFAGTYLKEFSQLIASKSKHSNVIVDLSGDRDLELEGAIAASRESMEMQIVLEESKQLADRPSPIEVDLERALVESRQESQHVSCSELGLTDREHLDQSMEHAIAESLKTHSTESCGNNSFDQDLRSAIEASLAGGQLSDGLKPIEVDLE